MGKIGVISVDSMCYHAHLETVHLIQILSEWHLMQVVYSLSRQHNRQTNVWGSSNESLLTGESFPQNIIGVGMMTWILIYKCWTAWGCIFYSLSTTSYHFVLTDYFLVYIPTQPVWDLPDQNWLWEKRVNWMQAARERCSDQVDMWVYLCFKWQIILILCVSYAGKCVLRLLQSERPSH